MFTDRVFAEDILLAAEIQAKVTKSPVYVYSFGYDSRYSFKSLIGKPEFNGKISF